MKRFIVVFLFPVFLNIKLFGVDLGLTFFTDTHIYRPSGYNNDFVDEKEWKKCFNEKDSQACKPIIPKLIQRCENIGTPQDRGNVKEKRQEHCINAGIFFYEQGETDKDRERALSFFQKAYNLTYNQVDFDEGIQQYDFERNVYVARYAYGVAAYYDKKDYEKAFSFWKTPIGKQYTGSATSRRIRDILSNEPVTYTVVEYMDQNGAMQICDLGNISLCDNVIEFYERYYYFRDNVQTSVSYKGPDYDSLIAIAIFKAKIEELYEKACNLGSIDSCFKLGNSYKNNLENYEKTWRYHIDGYGYKGKDMQNITKKVILPYQKACDLKDASGCYELGSIYFAGFYVKQDLAKAKESYGKACDLGDQKGCDKHRDFNQ